MWEIDRTAPRRALLMVAATPPIGSARAAQPPSPPLRLTAADYAARCRTDSTKRAYAADWRGFESWCRACGASALPSAPSTIGAYLADAAARLKPATLKRQLATIVVIHRQAGFILDRRDPAIADVLTGICRTLGTQPAQKAALLLDDVRQLVAVLPDSLLGLRDRAVLLFGFAGAFRRSELAALTTTDLSWRSEGLVVALHRAKEDQQGEGEVKAIPFVADQTVCPVRAVRAWAIAAGLDQGPLFRRIDRTGAASPAGLSGEAIAAIVKRAVAQAGKAQGWSKAEILRRVAAVAGHSLRAGYVTSAARAGIPEWAIMQHTGQRQTTTLRRYIRQGEMFATTPAKGMEW